MWMGAHPDLPSEIEFDGQWIPLNQVIAKYPQQVLGKRVAQVFHQTLPFLFKVLAAAQPLSIQVHPSKTSAESGFQKENEMGIPLNAFHRNYKDTNHKPEIIAALTPFFGLRGFRPLQEIKVLLNSIPECHFILDDLREGEMNSVQKVYEKLIRLSDVEVHRRLEPIIQRLLEKNSNQAFTKDTPEYWILRSNQCYSQNGMHDRGLFSFFLLNLVKLLPGQAMYLTAGILHAYLEGVGIELMANSNNVLRGGLTTKHVDVDELLKNLTFREGKIDILCPEPKSNESSFQVFNTSSTEFELQKFSSNDASVEINQCANGPEILLPTSLEIHETNKIVTESCQLDLRQGYPILICHGVNYSLKLAPEAQVFRAVVPQVL